jgi:hypothetical protein
MIHLIQPQCLTRLIQQNAIKKGEEKQAASSSSFMSWPMFIGLQILIVCIFYVIRANSQSEAKKFI